MRERVETQRRKALRNEMRSAEKQKAEAELPAPKGHLLSLFEWVDKRMQDGCDHTLKHTVAFIRANDLDEEATIHWIKEHGGFCDCEVVMNVQDSSAAFR